ncbi:MAG: phosphate ABC transporter permease subunit PstC [Candidatus Didemnitutus sp.]|nr:phosphate ABC transporter permease subunit PstC [Candidatus Didemnitutus sp.]
MAETATAARPTRLPTSEALLRRQRGWFFGLSGDRVAKVVFQSNAAISILVLALITFTIFRDAVGFVPQNRQNLEIYRLAGLEFTDHLRREVEDYSAFNRYLGAIRSDRFAQLQRSGLSIAAAQAQLADFDAYANRVADAISAHETILGTLTDTATSLKERQKVAQDTAHARADLERALPTATPAHAAELRRQIETLVPETINFRTEVQAMKDQLPEMKTANTALAATLADLAAHAPRFSDAALDARLAHFTELMQQFPAQLAAATKRMETWDQLKPVSFAESLTAFAFGRDWITASFWQDWYGILPLFFGSLLISIIALAIAIPLGIAAAVYVNQVARPVEQRFIKPTIEFVSAIPSVVLGFFGIAVLGESLRKLSQLPALDWVPGFPFSERLNATTAACLLALMAVPTIFSLAEDAINNVPRSFKEASLALGSTRLQTIVHIIIPSALSGIMAAILLGLGRVIGETMVVLLCAGNRIQIPDFTAGIGTAFQPVHTMTGIIAQEMGEVVRGSLHYRALFMVGVLLFLISLLINWLAQKIVRRYRIAAS